MTDLDRLAIALRPLVFRLYFVVRRETPQHQLTLAQGAVLSELATAGPCRMSHLAATGGVRLPSMTDVVARLERLGLVEREPDPEDRRGVRARLTDEGSRLHTELVVAREEYLRGQLGALDDADRAAIDAAIPALWRLLRAHPDADSTHSPPAAGTDGGTDSPEILRPAGHPRRPGRTTELMEDR